MSVSHTQREKEREREKRARELPFNQRAAKSLPGRRTSGNTNQSLVVQGDGWNHVRLVKIQGENIPPSAHSQVSSELALVLRKPHFHMGELRLQEQLA